MYLNQEALESMAWEDYRALECRMCAWALAAEAEMRSEEEPRQIIIDLLTWARSEFRRRRRYMEQEEPQTERWAGAVLRALTKRAQEAQDMKKAREQ